MPAEIRLARPADSAAIAALAAESLPERWSEGSFRAELEAPGARGMVAVDASGALWGYALGARADREFEIRSLAVASSRRRSGLGRRLLCALLEAERERGAKLVVLEVRLSNAAARRLYAGAGFEARAERPRYYADGESAIVMGLDL